LASDLTFGDHIQPACLPEASYDPVGEKCFVSGWGTLYSGAFSLPETLQWVDVPIITNSDCDAAYTTYDITDSMICAAYPEGGKDACQGDSGGPLVCEVDGDAIITGVVSWGIGCADADHPGVYGRVTEVLSWIESNMGSGGSAPQEEECSGGGGGDGCELPQWADDLYCDDGNNNAECNWDGGACCQESPANGWDTYCTACECKDEEPACEDVWSAKKCKKAKKKNKCKKSKTYKNCMKTCDNCGEDAGSAECEDTMSSKKCKKLKKKGKCNKASTYKKCMKTCGKC